MASTSTGLIDEGSVKKACTVGPLAHSFPRPMSQGASHHDVCWVIMIVLQKYATTASKLYHSKMKVSCLEPPFNVKHILMQWNAFSGARSSLIRITMIVRETAHHPASYQANCTENGFW